MVVRLEQSRYEEANNNNNNNNNKNHSIQLFIIYVPSQQLNGQLQTQHNLNAGIYNIENNNNKNNNKFHQLS
jgi:hypothetical protein